MAHVRMTVSLPVDVAGDLEYLSSLLGISRSGIVSVLLADRLRGVNYVLSNHVAGSLGGNTADSSQLLRLRGKPAKHIRAVLADLVHQSTFVDPDQFELTSYRDGGDDA